MLQVPRLPPQVDCAASHVKPLQHAPAPAPGQLELEQQACPAPPHGTNVPALQTVPPSLVPDGTHWPDGSRQPPAWQVPPLHGGWNAPPQLPHVPFTHVSPAALHRLPAQQACAVPPHAAHWPVPRHTSPAAQWEPAAMHSREPCASQHPAVQFAPAQHGSPMPPHAWHTPMPQTSAPVQAPPAQQG